MLGFLQRTAQNGVLSYCVNMTGTVHRLRACGEKASALIFVALLHTNNYSSVNKWLIWTAFFSFMFNADQSRETCSSQISFVFSHLKYTGSPLNLCLNLALDWTETGLHWNWKWLTVCISCSQFSRIYIFFYCVGALLEVFYVFMLRLIFLSKTNTSVDSYSENNAVYEEQMTDSGNSTGYIAFMWHSYILSCIVINLDGGS